jgi:hypothetical protein
MGADKGIATAAPFACSALSAPQVEAGADFLVIGAGQPATFFIEGPPAAPAIRRSWDSRLGAQGP